MSTAKVNSTSESDALPSSLVSAAIAAIHLAELALKWKVMKDLAKSAAKRLERILPYAHDPALQCKFYVVLWALRKLPYVHTSLICRSLSNLKAISRHFEVPDGASHDT